MAKFSSPLKRAQILRRQRRFTSCSPEHEDRETEKGRRRGRVRKREGRGGEERGKKGERRKERRKEEGKEIERKPICGFGERIIGKGTIKCKGSEVAMTW